MEGVVMEKLNVIEFKKKIFDFGPGKEWKFEGDLPAIVDFYADWCGPCRMQAPILEEISKEVAGKVRIYKVDTEASPELAALFRIRGIPALLFIPKAGNPALFSGFTPKEIIREAIQNQLGVEMAPLPESETSRQGGGCCS